MENFIVSALGILTILSISLFYINKTKKEMVEKMDLYIKEKDLELSQKINTIKIWEKYIDFSIGDPILIKLNLVNTVPNKDDIEYKAFIEAKITDLSQTQAKLELIDFSTSVTSSRITKNGIDNYLKRFPWHNLSDMERILTLQERREMQLNKLL
jgi:hypothetical protein